MCGREAPAILLASRASPTACFAAASAVYGRCAQTDEAWPTSTWTSATVMTVRLARR